jgi:hypothetical protein
MTGWPDEAIRVAATWYIHSHCMHEEKWRYTRLLSIHATPKSNVSFESNEVPIVSCEIAPASWYLMTSRRLIASCNHLSFEVNPLDIEDWNWGDFKTDLNLQIGDAKISVRNAGDRSFQYETGWASMAPIYYARFWLVKFPVLPKLDIDRLRSKLGWGG